MESTTFIKKKTGNIWLCYRIRLYMSIFYVLFFKISFIMNMVKYEQVQIYDFILLLLSRDQDAQINNDNY